MEMRWFFTNGAAQYARPKQDAFQYVSDHLHRLGSCSYTQVLSLISSSFRKCFENVPHCLKMVRVPYRTPGVYRYTSETL